MTAGRATFRNPVYPRYFADPYVIRAHGRWWAIGTSGADAMTGLVSDDLVSWEPWTLILSSNEPHLDGRTHAWAPEVTSHGDRFHLYFSAGVEDRHHKIFVADADSPDGPYVDVRPLEGIAEPFAIDAHVFSERGNHYLYYAVDRTDRPRVGTVIVVQELVEPDRVDASCRPVVLPGADWQIYERQRSMYGAMYDWHTCEGPSWSAGSRGTGACTPAGPGRRSPTAWGPPGRTIPWDHGTMSRTTGPQSSIRLPAWLAVPATQA